MENTSHIIKEHTKQHNTAAKSNEKRTPEDVEAEEITETKNTQKGGEPTQREFLVKQRHKMRCAGTFVVRKHA